ncbi:MAG: SurA N-terminal domain-containing protein [Candidatus Levybacteria bacterium]|nr:SurA N-terminal domain-containing protein [Candidatus Levybacteria bacterium]
MAIKKNQKSPARNAPQSDAGGKIKMQKSSFEKASLKIQDKSTPSVSNYPLTSKLKQPKVFIGLIVVILAIAAFFLRGLFVAALVNGQPITRLALIQELEKQGGKQTLSALVNQALILQEAKKKNVEISQKEIDNSVKQVEDSLKTQGQNLDTALAVQGMTKQDFIMQLKIRILVEKLLVDKMKVTDKEVSDYMEKNKETLPTDVKENELRKQVKQQLEQQKLASASQAWLEELNKNAKINYFVNY